MHPTHSGSRHSPQTFRLAPFTPNVQARAIRPKRSGSRHSPQTFRLASFTPNVQARAIHPKRSGSRHVPPHTGDLLSESHIQHHKRALPDAVAACTVIVRFKFAAAHDVRLCTCAMCMYVCVCFYAMCKYRVIPCTYISVCVYIYTYI
jgi:hypothetical protein